MPRLDQYNGVLRTDGSEQQWYEARIHASRDRRRGGAGDRMSRAIRVIVWAPAASGQSASASPNLLDEFELVGVYAYSDAGNGVDAGATHDRDTTHR